MTELARIRQEMEKVQVDGILVTSSYNRKYMTGFTGSAGVVLISQKEAKFITDFRYVEQARKQAATFEIVEHRGTLLEEIAKQVEGMGIAKLAFEQDYVTFATYKAYESAIKANLVPISGMIENLRLIKTPSEIKILKEAANVADRAFSHILSFIRPGVTELDVSNELEFYMRKQGATSSSFDIIVASGARSALPHGVATDKVIEHGDLVTLDFGAAYQGYVSDITRTVAVGKPSEELRKIYDIVLEAQLRGMAGIKAGMTGKEADALTRDFITEKGYGKYFGHSTGHGIGMEVHEGPALSVRSDTMLKPGMVVTVEPGIYLPGVGGVRIEDDTIITATGNEPLTFSKKELIIL